MIMYLRNGSPNIPLENVSDEELYRIEANLDMDADVFDSEEEFFAANSKA